MSLLPEAQAHTCSGVLQGTVSRSLNGKQYYSFLGVPYAEPPTGERRFKAPIPKKPWSGVLDATKEGNASCQIDLFDNGKVGGDEDCLYLNIHTPKLPSKDEEDELYPVMFYIHGGGFVFGSGSPKNFSGDFFVESNTILVTINYRLGALGFMCLDIPEVPGNAGLRDQNLAMKWVQENIRSFNGDPDNVTIFGISAGSASVEYHILSPMSKGLFHKAILQSGSSLNPWAKTFNPKKLVEKYKNILNIDENDPHKVLSVLQGIDAGKLVDVAMRLGGEEEHKNAEIFTFTPVVEKVFDGVQPFLDKEPIELLEDGLINKVPTITGFCDIEGGLFKVFYCDKVKKEVESGNFIYNLPECFNVDRIFFKQCLDEVYNSQDKVEDEISFITDMSILGGVHESLKHRCRFTNTDFFYMFTYSGNINYIKINFKIDSDRAYHGDDTSYLALMDCVDESKATEQDKLVRRRMVKMWTDFAKTGNPTPEQCDLITTEWLPATTHNMHLLEIGKDLKMIKFPFGERMEVWENIYESSVNLPRK